MVRAELLAIEPAAGMDCLAADDGLDALLARVEGLSDDEIEALLAAGVERAADD